MSRIVRAVLDELGPDELAELAERLAPFLAGTDEPASGRLARQSSGGGISGSAETNSTD